MLIVLALISSLHGADAAPWAVAPSEPIAGLIAAYGAEARPTALVVVQGERIVATWGDPARRVNVRSVRKSLLGALYGSAVADGKVALTDTLGRLEIDDTPPRLSAAEKQATVGDLLTARSGVYHPATYETADMGAKRPARGSHPPGTFWYYNNWDFNALGTIYGRATGDDVFEAFARRIAGPIGMEDFSARDGRRVADPVSLHPAHVFSMSARDLARFGRLYRDEGRWGDRQVVPADWVTASLTAWSATDRGSLGYGRLWWTLPARFGPKAGLASGYGGQAIAVVPAKGLVVVQTVDLDRGARRLHTSAFLDLVGRIAEASPAR